MELVFFDAGGGHRAAANALRSAAEEHPEAVHWDVRLLNLQDLLEKIDPTRKYLGIRVEDIYNSMVRRQVTMGMDRLMDFLQWVVRKRHGRIVELLQEHWSTNCPDLVVSLIPHFNRALFDGVAAMGPQRAAQGLPTPELLTVLTDLADYPPHFWLEKQDQDVVCGTEKAVEQARAIGVPENRIHRASGMIVHPRFYRHDVGDRHEEHLRLGFDPSRPTGLVSFGGQGSRTMLDIARQVERCVDRLEAGVQLIFVCGHNESLRRQLESLPTRYAKHVEGYSREMPRWLGLSDFFVGKPGPGSISEALLMGLPVIVKGYGGSIPQERYNLEWVREREVGIVVEQQDGLGEALVRLLDPAQLVAFRRRVAALDNRAIFEVMDLMAAKLAAAALPQSAAA